MSLREGEDGPPCRTLRLSEGSGEKKGRKHVEWWTEKMDEGMLFVPKAVTALLQGFSFNAPISFIYSHLLSCIALPQLFHFLPPPSPPSQCFAPSRFFLIPFSLTCNKRLRERVWRLNEQHQPPHEGREEGDGAGSRRLRRAHRSDAGQLKKWFPFPATFLLEFEGLSIHLIPSFTLHFLSSTHSTVLAVWNWEKWKFWEWGDEGGQPWKHAVGYQKKRGENPAGLLTDLPKILWFQSLSTTFPVPCALPDLKHVETAVPRQEACFITISSLFAVHVVIKGNDRKKKQNSGMLVHVRTCWCPHCGGVGFDLKANWPLTFVFQ